MQYPVPYSNFAAIAVAAAWLIWLAGLVFNQTLLPFSIALANLAAAYTLLKEAKVFPHSVKRAIQGLAYGLLVLVGAELVLGYEWVSNTKLPVLHEVVYISGVLIIAFWGTYFSWAIEGLGLRDKGHGARVFLGALLGSLVTVLPIFWLKAITLVQFLYALVTFYLTLLFLIQLVVMMGIRLKRSLQNMAWAMVLLSIGRLVSIFGGSEQFLLYGIFWLGAMSWLVWGYRAQQQAVGKEP